MIGLVIIFVFAWKHERDVFGLNVFYAKHLRYLGDRSVHKSVCVFSRKICPLSDGNFCQVSVFVGVILSA